MLAIDSTSNSTSFKQVNIIRISRRAFPKSCRSSNKDILDNILFEKNLESNGIKAMKIFPIFSKEKGLSVNAIYSAENECGTRYTKVPLKKGYYTYCVLTGEEKDKFFKHFTPDLAYTEMLNDPIRKQGYSTDFLGHLFSFFAKHPISPKKWDEFDNKVREIVASKKPSEFIIDSLDELDAIKPKLGLK